MIEIDKKHNKRDRKIDNEQGSDMLEKIFDS